MMRFLAFVFVLVFAVPAFATDWDWDLGSGNPSARQRAQARHARRYYKPKVMGWTKEDDAKSKDDKGKDKDRADERGWQCLGKVRGLGTQWIGTEGALDAAKKDWMERVRYDHGESFIDMSNAKDFESRCGRVSIGEVAGQVTYRCEILARPCKPPLKEVVVKAK